MKTITGQFATRALADRAVDALKSAGIDAERIRIWNNVSETTAKPGSGGAVTSGALTGALLGGVGGLIAGAAVGKVVEGDSSQGTQRSPSSGVRVVVELAPGGPEAAAILEKYGATHVA